MQGHGNQRNARWTGLRACDLTLAEPRFRQDPFGALRLLSGCQERHKERIHEDREAFPNSDNNGDAAKVLYPGRLLVLLDESLQSLNLEKRHATPDPRQRHFWSPI